MVRAGEDPKYIFRRMLILAAEDIGLADPQALVVAEAAAAEAEVITLKAELARARESVGATEDGRADSQAVADLEARLTRKSEEHDRLARALESEQRRVMELERERELQNKSLRVLHQQLELEKERGQHLVAEQWPGDIAGALHESRPVGAELEAHRDAADDAHGETQREHLDPEAVGVHPLVVPGGVVAQLEEQQHPRECNRDHREQDVKADIRRELQARQHQCVEHTKTSWWMIASLDRV